MTTPGLEVEDLALRLGAFALNGASLAAAPGEILALLGPNGAGKSVCLEAIAGFHRLTRGRIRLAGRDMTNAPPERRSIGFVVQNFGLFPHLSVAENVILGCRDRGRGAAGAAGLLARFGIAHLEATRPLHLSPGEKQRVALARALASRPNLFLFDEPFAALDATTGDALRQELATFLHAGSVPAVFVTHDRVEARALADRVAIIDGGIIRQQGAADEVFDHPADVAVARFLGVENLLDGRIAEIAEDSVRVEIGSASVMVQRPAAACARGQPATLCIRAEQVRLSPPNAHAVSNRLGMRVSGLGRLGPLWKVTLDGGFPLIVYALPQTIEACALAPGAAIEAAIDAASIHMIVGEGGRG
jgi:molybdate/tungstate transport system ATP-binding protein